jgi:integrase/recombinase XerD
VQHFEQFIRSRQFLKNVTPKTLDWYATSFAALRRHHPGEEFSKASLDDFVISLRESGVSPISCNTYCRAINAYLRWVHEEGYIDLLLRIPPLKCEQKILPTLSVEQVKAVLNFRPRVFSEQRIYALLCLLLDSGLRIEEALCLTRDRVDFQNMLVTVKGKGEKHRVVPISLELRKILFRWLSKHEYALVFPTREGVKQCQRNVLRDMKELGSTLGISGVRFSFHTLRHTFALNYIRNGGDVFRLQRILGHSTLEMTRRYVNLQTADLQAVHDRLSILASPTWGVDK